LFHLLGLVLAVGAATIKIVLLMKCKSDYSLIPVYLKVVRPITRILITGLILLTLSGIGWLLTGYPFTGALIIKLSLVLAVWILGPVIDNVAEPKFRDLAAVADNSVSADFIKARNNYLTLEIIATGIFYVIMIYWVL
jgi:hypothetical protein